MLDEIAASRDCVVSDGAWGTELINMGLPADSSPEEWNLLHPERVLTIAKKYVEAGARILLTNTFGGNAFRLSRYGLEGSIEKINRVGAEISKEAAGDHSFVFGSMGPTGKLLALKKVDAGEVFSTYKAQATALWRGGVDAVVVETMGELQELQLAARAVQESCPLPVVLSMTFESGPDKNCTMTGVTPEQAVEEMQRLGAWMIGANCGAGPEAYVQICRRMRSATDVPIWVKPNAGMPVIEGNQLVYKQTPEIFGCHAVQLRKAGATVIGGCCGTTPAHIRHLSQLFAAT
jgi:methionine synthase I (cobalamin-dependent)